MRRTTRWCAVAAAMAVALTPAATAVAGTGSTPTKAAAKAAATANAKDRNIPVSGTDDAEQRKLKKIPAARQRMAAPAPKAATAAPKIGDVRLWLALDDVHGYYLKPFQLQGDGQHIQIWVAVEDDGNGGYRQALTFPAGSTGECRNDVFNGGEVTVSQAQIDNFIHEFDTNMFPKESKAFSNLVSRDGSNAGLSAYYDENGNVIPVPDGNFEGPGDKVVTLVDNVRDANYYDPSTPDGQTYIAGFFSSTFASVLDRNIMTIDSFDWLHRTGANPPDDTNSADAASCAYAGATSRPHMYEGTFAHEYQHLLENDQDADEVNWVNEGLSDWAQTLVGYVNTNRLPTNEKADRHISCFQGYLGENFGGPENSLTQWEDQGGPEVLCDYGAAYSIMEYLHGRFGGDRFMSYLHKAPGNGLVGLQAAINHFGYRGITAQEVVHQWLAMMALDHQIDRGAKLKGGAKRDYTTPTLKSVINWDSPQAYSSPGAPPNGADYVRLGDRRGYISAKRLESLEFKGAGSFAADPVEWTVDDGRLYSGSGNDLDRAITRTVTVPTDNPTLTADLEWATELGWDFAFVQVYDAASQKWVSLSNADTTSEHDPSAAANVVANLPGFTGPSANADQSSGVKTETFDLSKWKGQTIDIAFRYITDAATVGAGFWVDNVKVGDTVVSDGTDLGAWQSLTQAHPVKVAGWTVQLVAYGNSGKAYVGSLRLRYNEKRDVWVGRVGRDVADLVGDSKQTKTVAALVTADDPTETATAYPTYQLTANGVLQSGGS